MSEELEAGDDIGLKTRYWVSNHVDADYIASTFGEKGWPSKERAMQDAILPSDNMYEITIEVRRTYMDMVCIGCDRAPNSIMEYIMAARENEMEPDEYVWHEEGTLNRSNGHFACDHCYIKMGTPSGPNGTRWVAP